MSHSQQFALEQFAQRVAAKKSYDLARHKCFISYHAADTDEVKAFIEAFGTEFIAKTVGVTDEDDFIDSADSGYILDKIRTKYLGDSSVTIVLVGACTWARRYVDWEVYSSLRSSKHSSVNGLLAIALPSIDGKSSGKLPARVQDNVKRDANNTDTGYARWNSYPSSTTSLRRFVDEAFAARTSRSNLIDNARTRKINSSSCTP